MAPLEWEVVPNVEGYTGLFKTGSKFGLIRASLAAKPPQKKGDSTTVPGVAVKFFREGLYTSVNFMAMFSLQVRGCQLR